MKKSPIWLYDRLYDFKARERLRQLALWSPSPILVYLNSGMPYGSEREVEEEVTIYQKEGLLKFWKYEAESTYPESLASFLVGTPTVIQEPEYGKIVRYVDQRLEESVPDLHSLGFDNMEGMLLEQVVLRRRFFSQAICGALGVKTIADSRNHVDMYSKQLSLYERVSDTLEQFFKKINVPSLALMDIDSFLALREKSRAILPEIALDIAQQIENEVQTSELTQINIVNNLIGRYESELRQLVSNQSGLGARGAFESFESGTLTQIESQQALFLLSEELSDMSAWFIQNSEGQCKLALLLLELKYKR